MNFVLGELLSGFKLSPARRSDTFGGYFVCPELSRNSPETLVLSYRDLSAGASGLDRFIPVYSDESKVMTCFLEFDRPDTVLVHDLVYSREGEQWHFEKSSYRKLRLPVEWLENAMIRVGFSVQSGQAGRLLRLVGQKH